MQDKELLEQLKTKELYHHSPLHPYYAYHPQEHAAILSLLSQQEVVVESDEEAAKKYADSKFVSPFDNLYDNLIESDQRIWWAYYNTYKEARQSLRQQLSQQQGASPIKLGDRSITQDEFNRMYTHYKDLCDKEDTNGWWENQYYMADKERNELRNWKAEAMAVMPDYPAICKALKVPLGQSIHDKILPAILKLQQLAQQQATKWLKLKEFIQKHIQQLDGAILTTSGEDKLALLKDILAYADESAPLSQQQQQRQYSEEAMLSFCEWVANESWREDFLEQRTLTTKELLYIYNKLPKQ